MIWSVNATEWAVLPLTALAVTLYVPRGAVEVLTVSVAGVEASMEPVLNVPVAPAGSPLTLNVAPPLNPPDGTSEMT